MSLGAGLRERFESNDAPSFGVGQQTSEQYVVERAEIHVDIHPNAHWQIFAQLQDDRAFGKAILTPVDADNFDPEQAFSRVRLGRKREDAAWPSGDRF